MHICSKTTRRGLMISVGMATLVLGVPGRSLADGSFPSERQQPSTTQRPPRTQRRQTDQSEEPTTLSTGRFLRLSRREVRRLEDRSRAGEKFRMDGFSDAMTTWIIYMGASMTRQTQRLIRDMAELEDNAERRARLEREIRLMEAYEANLKDSIERLEGSDSGAVSEEYKRLNRVRDYLEGLRVWVRFPHEGAR